MPDATMPIGDLPRLRRLLRDGELSPVDVAEECIARSERADRRFNILVTELYDSALADAARAEHELREGTGGPLCGIPITVKDNIAVEGCPVTNGSRTHGGDVATRDARAVGRLRSAGAVVIGKTTCSEFAVRPVGYSPLTGMTLNPWDPATTTGGSSCGAAVSAACETASAALVTDGGGSARIPASLCGVYGVKPQQGEIEYTPTSATPRLSHIGVISTEATSAHAVLDVLRRVAMQRREGVPSSGRGACRVRPGQSSSGIRVAWSPTLGYAHPDADIVASVASVLRTCSLSFGWNVEVVDAPFSSDPAEAFFGDFLTGAGYRLRRLLRETPEVMDSDVVRILSHLDERFPLEAYLRLKIQREDIRRAVRAVFESYDFLISPTLPIGGLPSEKTRPGALGPLATEDELIGWVRYTYPFNIAGCPAVSVPCGTDGNGIPVGMQIVSAGYNEDSLLAMSEIVESASDFSRLRQNAVQRTVQGE